MDFIKKLFTLILATNFVYGTVAIGYVMYNSPSASVVYKDGDRLDFVTYAGDTSPVEFITKLRSIASFHFDTIEGVEGENFGEDFSMLSSENLMKILKHPVINEKGEWEIQLKDGDKSVVNIYSDGRVEADIDITDTWLQLTAKRIELNDVFRDKGKKKLIAAFTSVEESVNQGDYIVSAGIFDTKTRGKHKYKYKLDITSGDTRAECNIKLCVSYPKMAKDLVEYVKESIE